MTDHLRFMKIAYQEALKALDEGEVPIGALIIRDQQIIGRGYNRVEQLSDATAHAEIIAISAASNSSDSWRLDGCTLYVTVEPCVMCLGAIMQSRIETIVYGAADPRCGAIDSHSYRRETERIYRRFPKVTANILGEDCSRLLTGFFAKLRKQR
ncbi:MAG: nucleoside deaminase [Chitinispirillaceae bacterium]|nr:nucleoside deaminase [Chitinispirillaceae bacterium]